MDQLAKIPIPRIEGYECFACGTENPIGLGMTFYRQGDAICSEVVLDDHHVGWQQMAHGGIISTLLDETMAWTVLCLKQTFCVTREIKTRFRKPVPVQVPLTVRGEIVEDDRKFACKLRASIVDQEGTVLATAAGDFALLRDDQLDLLPEHIRKDVGAFLTALKGSLR